MAKICPQRVIKEAMRIIRASTELLDDEAQIALGDEFFEEVDNNLLELDTLQKALYRDGIINIQE